MSRYLTPRTVFIIIKLWTVGVPVFKFGVVLPHGGFRVAQGIKKNPSLIQIFVTAQLPLQRPSTYFRSL